MLHEPAVALTDFGLAVEGIVLAWMLARSAPSSPLRCWFIHFFISVAIAAALGGTVHGFLPDESTAAYAVLWRATLLSIGYTALAAAMAAAHLLRSSAVKKAVQAVAVTGLVVYVVVVVFVSQEFRNAIFAYVPCTVFLLIAFVVVWSRSRSSAALVGTAGMLLTFVAAAVQQSSLAVPALHLDHNAIYHIIQAIAFILIFIAAKTLARQTPVVRRSEPRLVR